MTEINAKSLSNKVESSKGFSDKLDKSRVLMQGTDAMRSAGEKYLPKFEGETDKHYELRKKMSYLFNAFRKTVRDMSGRVFSKPITIDDADESFKEYSEDIDLEGHSITSFARSVLESGLQSGIEYLLIDSPPKTEGETRADALGNNLRPYIVHIKPDDVLGWKAIRINNKRMISQFRFQMNTTEDKADDEFATEDISQIRVFDLVASESGDNRHVMSRIFRKGKKDSEYVLYETTVMSEIDAIPIVPFYANQTGFFTGEPVLEDLADLNIAHWQSQSDQRNILHFTRVPILFAKGVSQDSTLVISASQVTKSANPEADLKFVEHNGNSIKAGQEDLAHLEFQMETQGLQLLLNKNAATATGELRNEVKEVSQLKTIAGNLQDALQQCFIWMGIFASKEFKGKVNVNDDLTVTSINSQTLNILLQSVFRGALSRRTFWIELQRYGLLRPDFNAEEEEERIDEETGSIDDIPFPNDDD